MSNLVDINNYSLDKYFSVENFLIQMKDHSIFVEIFVVVPHKEQNMLYLCGRIKHDALSVWKTKAEYFICVEE